MRKTIPSNDPQELNSLQTYGHIWPQAIMRHFERNYTCGYCLIVEVKEQGDVCKECRSSLDEMDGVK